MEAEELNSGAPNTNPDYISALEQKEKAELILITTALQNENEVLKHNLSILKRALFGKRSEKLTDAEREQYRLLFNEAEEGSVLEQEIMELESQEPVTDENNKKKKLGRRPLPKNLPRKQVIYDIKEEEKVCECGCALSRIGSEVSEQLDYIPAKLQVIEHIRYKYACKSCEENVKCAGMPTKPLPKANATSGLLAHILVSKFEDHLPLYRQSLMWERLNIDIPRSTMCNWVISCGNLLQPLVSLLRKDITEADYIASDETRLQVLKNEASTSYMWVHISGNRERRAVVCNYQDSRSGECALKFLQGFEGYHQCDAYSGYNQLHAKSSVSWVGCWAHARRKFIEITKIVKTPGIAHRIVNLIGKLYKIEREATDKGLDPGGIKALRAEKAEPILKEISKYLEDCKDKVPPKGALGKAIDYVIKHWQGLITYLEDGRLRIDNNDTERVIKAFAVGRKNWLFCDTPRGAESSANIYSIIQTCKANKINAYEYLRYVLANIRNCRTEADFNALLPYNIDKNLLTQPLFP